MTTRGEKEPHRQKQVSYRPPVYRNEEIRRASEQTSPQVARAAGQARKGRTWRLEQWQQLKSPFSHLKQFFWGK